jgi:hypothetical protein
MLLKNLHASSMAKAPQRTDKHQLPTWLLLMLEVPDGICLLAAWFSSEAR